MHGLTESQKAFRASVQRLADNTLAPLAEAIDRRDVFPEQAFELLARAGLLKMAVPKKYDGLSLGAMEICLAISELARISAATALMAVASTATTRLLDLAANQDQRKRWLSFLGRGDKLAAFCLTESQAGSDAAAIRTAARRRATSILSTGSNHSSPWACGPTCSPFLSGWRISPAPAGSAWSWSKKAPPA